MHRFALTLLIATAAVAGIGLGNVCQAGARHHHAGSQCEPCQSCQTNQANQPCLPCQPAQPCVEYEERLITVEDIDFKEVVEKKQIPTVAFTADKETREVTVTCLEDRVPTCGPVNACGPTTCCPKVPVQCIREVQVPIVRESPTTQTVEVKHIVEVRTSRTIKCKVPKTRPCDVPSCCAPEACAK